MIINILWLYLVILMVTCKPLQELLEAVFWLGIQILFSSLVAVYLFGK